MIPVRQALRRCSRKPTDVHSELTGQIADILLMDDFKRRFAQGPNEAGEYEFSVVREGLVVALLSIGTLIGKCATANIRNWSKR
jgi:SP family sugar:H+ symporter-like MFS transporter